MKKILIALSVLMTFSVQSQICEAVILKKGTSLTYTQFDKKGKETSKSTHVTSNVQTNDGNVSATITMESIIEKQDEPFKAEYNITCSDNELKVDMARFFDTNQLAAYQSTDMEVIMDGDILAFPSELSPNSALNDGTITVKVNSGAVTIVTLKMNITNRKVTKNESVTTAAGTFNCTKVTYDFESKVGFIKVRGSGEEWYSDYVLVKSASYNKKGKLISTSELTSK